MSGRAVNLDAQCRSLGFVNNPPRGYFKTVKTCYPGVRAGAGAAGGPTLNVLACNVGNVDLLDGSPAFPESSPDLDGIAEVFRDITMPGANTKKLNFRRWACYGEDDTVPGDGTSPGCGDELSPPKPICVLRGTDTTNDMIHLRNFKNAITGSLKIKDLGDGTVLIPTVLGVSCDDTTIVFNQIRLQGGIALPPPNGNGNGEGGGEGLGGENVGEKGSPPIVTLSGVGEVFDEIDQSMGFTFRFRRLFSAGDDTVPRESPAAVPASVLRGTDEYNDVICFRNLNNRPDPQLEGVTCFPVLAGVSEDDTTIVFNPICLGAGFVLTQPSPGGGAPIIELGITAENVGQKESPAIPIVSLPDVGTVFDEIEIAPGVFNFRFRKLQSAGDDTVPRESPAAVPASVLRGTSEVNDVICFRNLNNRPDPQIEGVTCFPVLAGVSEDDTTVVFNPICLGAGLVVTQPSPGGGVPIIELGAKLRDCNTFLNSPIQDALTLVPGNEQTSAETDGCFTLASIRPSNSIIIENTGNAECPIYRFSVNLLQSPGIDAVLAGCENIPGIVPDIVDGLPVGERDTSPACYGDGEVCAGLNEATGILKFRKLISQGSGASFAASGLQAEGPFSVLRDTFDVDIDGSPPEGYVRFRNLDNIPIADSPAVEACPILAGRSNDCSTILFRQFVAGPNVNLTCEDDRIIVEGNPNSIAMLFSSGPAITGGTQFIGQGQSTSGGGAIDKKFNEVCLVSPMNGTITKMVVLIKRDDEIEDGTVTATVALRDLDGSPDAIRDTDTISCVVPPDSPATMNRCCVATGAVPIQECECISIKIEVDGVNQVRVAVTLLIEEA